MGMFKDTNLLEGCYKMFNGNVSYQCVLKCQAVCAWNISKELSSKIKAEHTIGFCTIKSQEGYCTVLEECECSFIRNVDKGTL